MDETMLKRVKILVEQHEDGFVAYPLGVTGAIVGEGDTPEDALRDARSALLFHIETFGGGAFDESPVLDAFLAEETVNLG
jgi:predicted RNase H-like HicB family nuclease